MLQILKIGSRHASSCPDSYFHLNHHRQFDSLLSNKAFFYLHGEIENFIC